MDTKWPFILLTLGLIFALGLTIAGLERKTVMNNWSNRRCELPVIMAAFFFKPDSDPRTKGDFAKDNFDFCMKTYIDKFMELLMAPINAVLSKQTNVTTGAVGMVDTVREIAQKLYNTLSSFLDQYMRRFNAGVYEMSRIVQYLRMAMRRANAVVMSMLYTGITIFRGMLNTIQFVIKVILIICGIMLAIIIILFFILFPVIPLILAVLGAIVATVMSLSMVMSGSLADEANNDKGGFCFAENTQILVNNPQNSENSAWIRRDVKDIKIGDELGNNCGKVTAIIKMDGTDVPLYNLNGIDVSGSHLVLGTDGMWKSVASDERAKLTNKISKILYCFNTTTHNIPVCTNKNGTKYDNFIVFRDWEELSDDDTIGQYTWSYTILKLLNTSSNYLRWKDGIKASDEFPLMGSKIKVKTTNGFINVKDLDLFGEVCDSTGKSQKILGVIDAKIEGIKDNGVWNTELYEFSNNVWIKGQSNIELSKSSAIGHTLITETGEFIIWDEMERREKIVRDFTEIGYNEIHKTYPLIASRLRLQQTAKII